VAIWPESAHTEIMNEHRRLAGLRTSQIAMVVGLTFGLGQQSVRFDGSGLAWTAVLLCVVGLALTLYLLIRDFWKINA
jgi:hypothetical protein